MMFTEQYLKERNRDFDYYLFWADEIYHLVFDRLIDSKSLFQCQIRTAHFLMDQGQDRFYQEDGAVLGEILWNTIQGGK